MVKAFGILPVLVIFHKLQVLKSSEVRMAEDAEKLEEFERLGLVGSQDPQLFQTLEQRQILSFFFFGGVGNGQFWMVF